MKLKKGSAAAKAYMAKIRAKRKTVKSEKGNWSLADRKQLAKELGEDFYSAEDWKKLTGKTKTKRSVAKKVSGTGKKDTLKVFYVGFKNRKIREKIEAKTAKEAIKEYQNRLKPIYGNVPALWLIADKENKVGTDKVYIEFLNKDKGFTKDKKFFDTYDKALAYIRKNFEKADPDMIKYVNGIGKAKRSVGSSLKLSSKEKRLGYTNHKDTKSHNVNIRVVSGVDMYDERNKIEDKIKIYTSGINRLKAQLLEIKNNPFAKDNFKREGYKLEVATLNRHIKFMSKNLIALKKQLKEQNRLISESLK